MFLFLKLLFIFNSLPGCEMCMNCVAAQHGVFSATCAETITGTGVHARPT